MKKYISIFIIAIAAIAITSCNKKVDVDAVSAILPGIQLSSLGMITPGPYVLPATTAAASTLQIVFGGTTTNKTPGAFDLFIYDNATPTVVFAQLHFNTWTASDSFNATSFGTISYVTVPSIYPNTTIYQGSIIIRYGGLPANPPAPPVTVPATPPTAPTSLPFVTGHFYNVKIVAYSSDYTSATTTTTSSTFPASGPLAKLIYIQ